MESLTCYVPGMLALASLHLNEFDFVGVGVDLVETCVESASRQPSGLPPESFSFEGGNEFQVSSFSVVEAQMAAQGGEGGAYSRRWTIGGTSCGRRFLSRYFTFIALRMTRSTGFTLGRCSRLSCGIAAHPRRTRPWLT
jgi:hypothetical protein